MRNKWKRKSLATLLALCMVFTMTPAAFAADDGGGSQTLQTDVSDGAQSNEENALQAQIDSAESGATITLSEDTTVASLTIPENKNITLDLGGNNLTLSGGVAVTDTAYESGTVAALMNSGTLSIVNGTLTGTGTACLIINRDTLNLGSDLTLSKSGAGNAIDNLGGTVTSAANITVTGNGYTAIVTYGGDVVVNSGTINALAANVASEDGQKENCGISVFNRGYDNESAGASVTINGGSITADAYVLSTNNIRSGGSNPSNVAINAGAFVSNNRTAVYWPSAGTLTVGTVGGDNAAVSITAEKGSAIEVCSGTLAVNSGTLKGSDSNDELNASSDMAAAYRANSGCAGIGDAVSIIARRGSGYDTAALNVAINGGSFSSSDNYAVRYFDCNQVANAIQIDQDVDVAIKGGTFTFTGSTQGSAIDASVVADDDKKFISGGKYANPLEPEWLEGLNTELHSQQSGLYSYYTSVDAALAAAEPGDEVTVLNASDTEATSTVTIKYGNGSEDLTLTVNNDTEITLPAAPSRDGYTFDGWIVNGERYAANAKVTINADTIIYADWQPPYTGKYSYEVFTSVGDNGTITVDRYATEGDKVTIEVTPDEAYLLDELVVTANGKEVELTDNGDGTYTFTMPSADVRISATFAEDPDWTEPEEPATDVSDIFIDVAPNAWYKDAVQYAYAGGLMTGVSANEFAPDATTTRGMIVSMLARLEGVESANDAGFADVEGEWYATAVNWAAGVGVVNGYEDGTFRPNDAITREQLAAILMNYAAYKGEDVSARASLDAYSDAENVSTWATDTMQWAVAKGLLTGVTADTLQPQGAATRAQVAAILQRFLSE